MGDLLDLDFNSSKPEQKAPEITNNQPNNGGIDMFSGGNNAQQKQEQNDIFSNIQPAQQNQNEASNQ